MDDQGGGATSAFLFEGNWREFAPIAFTNLLLTIVTLGIYRFWATARERRYLWSRTRFIDEHLEWSGTGKELFIGFVIVLFVVLLPFFLITQFAQALILRGHEGMGALVTLASFLLVYYLIGVARFRALRYRLSRTRWRGIRGGSDDPGFAYGWSYLWKNVVGIAALGLMVPWAMAQLWNERWNKMSFGPRPFTARLEFEKFFARYLLFYLSPIILIALAGLFAMIGAGLGAASGDAQVAAVGAMILGGIAIFLGIYLVFGLIALAFYAKYFREAVGALSWGEIDFAFTASTRQWLVLFLVDILLVVATLGVGLIFLRYRHWKFFVTHMEAYGEIAIDDLSQSTTATAGHGEGLLDAFDVGAI